MKLFYLSMAFSLLKADEEKVQLCLLFSFQVQSYNFKLRSWLNNVSSCILQCFAAEFQLHPVKSRQVKSDETQLSAFGI